MPLNDTYRSGGAAATNALFDFLAEREARRRQDMLDEITKSTASRQDKVARGQLDLQREQLTSLQEQRQAAADLNRQKKALGVIGMLSPESTVDADTADVIRQGGFGYGLRLFLTSCANRLRTSTPARSTHAPSIAARQSADDLQEVLMERLENASAGSGFFEHSGATPHRHRPSTALCCPVAPSFPYRSSRGRSVVGRRSVDVVNDDCVQRNTPSFQPKSQLLDSLERRCGIRLVRRWRVGRSGYYHLGKPEGREFHSKPINASQPGVIYDRAIHSIGEQ